MKYLFFYFFCCCLLCLAGNAQPVGLVMPTIHSSGIEQLSVTPGLPYLVSAAEDAVKIWEIETGRLIRTVPGGEQEGFAAAALSPDHQWLATAGNSYMRDMEPTVAPKLKLWDALTGAPIRVLHAFSIREKVLELRFSPDQRYLMAWVVRNFSNPTTILFDPESGKQILNTPGFGSFSNTGEQIIVRQDRAVVSVDIASGYTQTIIAEPCLLAEAVGGQVHLLTKTGSLLRWDGAKQSIVSNYPNILDAAQIDFLDYYPRRGNAQFSTDGQLLMACLPSPDTAGNLAESAYIFVGFNTKTGKIKCSAKAKNSPAERKGIYTPDLAFFLSAPITQELDNRSVLEAQLPLTGERSHSFGLQAFEKISWANKYSNLDIKVYSQGELIVVRGRSFGGWAAIFHTRLGKTVSIWEEEIDDYLQTNNYTVDERWQIVCEDYLSYQLIDNRSSDTLARLLFSENSLEGKEVSPNYTWAVTSPSGLFDASSDMMNKLHYVVGMEIIELEQLKARFYEPGLLQKLLGLNRNPIRETEGLLALPLYPKMNSSFSEDEWQLRIKLTPRNGGIGKLSFFINGQEIIEDANPKRQDSITINLKDYAHRFLPPIAPSSGYGLLTDNNILSLRAYNAGGWLKSAALNIPYQPPYRIRSGRSSTTNDDEEEILLGDEPPSLYALVIGTSNYAGEKLDLQFADRDAIQFHEALTLVAPGLFEDRINSFLLHTDDTDPQRAAIASKKEIQQRFQEIDRNALPQDLLLVYLSGHGVNYGHADSSQFYYLTKDIGSEDLSDPTIRSQYTISSAELTAWINSIGAAKKVMIIDACNSGKIVEDLASSSKDLSSDQIRALDRMKDRTGMFILTGSAADKVSFEAGRYGQGLLTYSLLQGMSGRALKGKEVDVMTLFQYCRDEVPELARGIGGIQTPMISSPTGGGSFPFGLLLPGVSINIPQEKPVFIRNTFQDEDSFLDELALGEAIGDHFRALTIKGAQADLIYVDVSQYNNAYAINGRYTQNGNDIKVIAKLFKDRQAIGEAFEVKGNKTNMPKLVSDIIAIVSQRL